MTRVLRSSHGSLKEAACLIMKGGIVAYPTDTVYGLGCDPFNIQALSRLVHIKGRKRGRLPLLIDSKGRAEEFGRFGTTSMRLARHFWPGPLTLVVPLRISLPDMITGSTDVVGLRLPRHHVAIELARASGGALVGTSANLSGKVPLRTARDITTELNDVDLVIDDKRTGSGVESSVLRIDNGTLSILREKSIRQGEILRFLKRVKRHDG